MFRNNKNRSNIISLEKWSEHFCNIYPLISPDASTSYGPTHEYLDRDISLSELQTSIALSKKNKAPGNDKILNEFYKHVPPNWEHYILNLFNNILYLEATPKKWPEIILSLIHKKGDKSEPNNYRGIALINTLCKLFTQILLSRLNTWLEEHTVIPEFQSGFRKNRSCIDNIFSLTSIVHSNIIKKR